MIIVFLAVFLIFILREITFNFIIGSFVSIFNLIGDYSEIVFFGIIIVFLGWCFSDD
ncbi:hypothetical protein GM3709_246 [Geminocystis sp. NIES-3709]|nr:hypothetical protein GM3709_246 [Geminocystis sp. NIES-3709]